MAQNVDLMVVGTSDSVSAIELTERLVTEFGQPAEAFTDLVAAACDGGSAYAAQSGVSLDTAVEGQAQLERLGVVCQVLMDGEVMGAGPAATATNDADIAEQPPASDTPENAIESSAVETVEVEIVLPEIDEAVELPADEVETKPALDESELEADDELFESIDAAELESDPDLTIDAEVETNDSEEKSAENGLAVEDINFSDELGSLDEEVEKTREKIKTEKEQKAKAAAPKPESVAEPEPKAEEAKEDVGEIEEVELLDESSETTADELTLDLSDEALEVPKATAKEDSEPAVKSAAGANDLELSLSLDDSAPLTKPKEKSNAVADDGGLTLSLDDSAPLASPRKPSEEAKPEALDASLLSDDESSIEASVAPSEPTVSPEPESIVPEVSEPLETVEARDTSKEHKEEIAPVLDEPEPDQPEKPETGDSKVEPETQLEDLATKEDASIPATPDSASAGSKVSDAVPDTSALSNLIDNLSENAGGLVLPGQVATDDIAPSNEVAAGQSEAVSEPVAAAIDQQVQPEQIDSVPAAASGESADPQESGGLQADAAYSRARNGWMKTAAVATLVVGCLGGGAGLYLNGGFGGSSNENDVTVAVVPQVNENSAFDAVEEVSLNAAIKRSTDISNPDDYSTEELIVYLADDLGANAQKELQNYVSGDGQYVVEQQPVPRMGAAIPADSNSVLWLKNRVDHPADKYFDEWAKREVDLKAYMELQERLIEVGDLEIARDVSGTTKDKLFAVMSLQRLARSYNELGRSDRALEVLELAARGTYSIASEAERTIAIADYALTEREIGLEEDALDSFLKASILARSLRKPESRTVALSGIAKYYQRVDRPDDMAEYLELAMTTAYELPVNTAARDLAIRHVALTEVRLGLTAQATDHANLIVDPFAAVSALHGIALELERTGDQTNARLTLNMAYRAGSLIKNSEKREKLLEKIKLAGG